MGIERKVLFGGDLKWNADDWTASDDRVRGGKSQSHLTPLPPTHTTARFHGNLDITALGSAGFASQRTASDTVTWDLSAFDGINIHLLTPSSSLPSEDDDKGDKAEGKGKVYTFILKDSLPETYVEESTGRTREKSTVSWECDFRVPKTSSKEEREGTGDREEKVISIPWRDFKPTYRGKEVKDAEPLDLEGVRRMSLMMRSFFGTQEGDFDLTLRTIEAVTIDGDEEKHRVEDESERGKAKGHGSDSETEDPVVLEKGAGYREARDGEPRQQQSWLSWIFGRCWKL